MGASWREAFRQIEEERQQARDSSDDDTSDSLPEYTGEPPAGEAGIPTTGGDDSGSSGGGGSSDDDTSDSLPEYTGEPPAGEAGIPTTGGDDSGSSGGGGSSDSDTSDSLPEYTGEPPAGEAGIPTTGGDDSSGGGGSTPDFGDPGFNPSTPTGQDPGLDDSGTADGPDDDSGGDDRPQPPGAGPETIPEPEPAPDDAPELPELVDPELRERRRSAVAEEIYGTRRVDQFDPDRNIERVGPGAFAATFGVDGGRERRRFAFSEEGQQTFRRRRREGLRKQAERSFEEQLGRDLNPEDIEITEEDGTLSARLSNEAETEIARERIETQLEQELAEEIVRRGSTIDPGSVPASQLPELDLTPGEDFTVEETDSGVVAELTDAGRETLGVGRGDVETIQEVTDSERRAAAYGVNLTVEEITDPSRRAAEFGEDPREALIEEQLEEQVAETIGADVDLTAGEDIEIEETDSGISARLTEEGQEMIQRSQADMPEEFGDYEVRDAGDLAPVLEGVPLYGSGIAATITALDEAGIGIGVSDLPQDIDIQTETVTVRTAGPGPRRMVEEQRVADVDVTTFDEEATLEDVLQLAQQKYSDVAAAAGQANVEYNPAASTAVDVAAGLGFGEEAETAIRSAGTQFVELGNLPALGLTVKETAEFAPYAGGEIVAGRGGISVEPGRAAALDESVIQIEEEGLAPNVGDRAEMKVTEAVEYIESNPVEFAGGAVGSLAGSAFIFGGAAAVGGRASLATRAAIQPGEEALGFGGHAVTRRVGGVRTAERLFPDKEPLVFSEEAALRRAQAAGTRIEQAGGRARTRISEADTPGVPSIESIRTEIRSAPVNLAIARANLEARLRGDRPSFRQKAVRGEIGTEDVQAIAAEEVDVPTQTDAEAEADTGGEGSMTVGGAIEVEQQTDSGVLVQRIRLEGESDQRTLTEAELRELEAGVETEAAAVRRFESAAEGVHEEAIEGMRLSGEVRGGLEELYETETGVDVDQILEQELDVNQEFETDLEIENEVEQELEQELEIERELEQELEFEQEVEQELEIETGDGPEQSDRLFKDDDELGFFGKKFEASVATPEEIIGSDIDDVDADVEADTAAIDEDLAEVFEDDGF